MIHPTFLIVGGVNDPEVVWFLQQVKNLTTLPVTTILLGTEEYPALHYDYQTDQLMINGQLVDPVVVWSRYHVFTSQPEEQLRNRRWHQIIQGWLLMHPEVAVLNRAWLNRLNNKISQLALAQQLEIPIPKTQISNLFSEISHNSARIVKPVDHGHCKASQEVVNRIMHHDLMRVNPESCHAVTATPVFLQPNLSSPEYRVFLISEEVFIFRIESTFQDYREDPTPKIMPMEVASFPSDLLDKLKALVQELQLDYAAIDLKSEGSRLIFLEVNDFPMFSAFDQLIGGKMATQIAYYLESIWQEQMLAASDEFESLEL